MKQGLFSFSSLLTVALVSSPLVAWADARPDFDDDAKPILAHQPGLVQYVESNFEVKDTGTAKLPGDDDHRPTPPYIFRARPIGNNGPFNLRLLIQPGPPGHILGVVDITKVPQTTDNPHGPSAGEEPNDIVSGFLRACSAVSRSDATRPVDRARMPSRPALSSCD